MNYTYNNRDVHQAWLLLKWGYILAPILVGVDKLAGWNLVDWSQYVSPVLLPYLHITVVQFVYALGLIEIAGGILVWVNPRIGGYTVAALMIAIIINLITMNRFYDIIARDAVITLGAIALAWLTAAQEANR